jgi:hypothetical protein
MGEKEGRGIVVKSVKGEKKRWRKETERKGKESEGEKAGWRTAY